MVLMDEEPGYAGKVPVSAAEWETQAAGSIGWMGSSGIEMATKVITFQSQRHHPLSTLLSFPSPHPTPPPTLAQRPSPSSQLSCPLSRRLSRA